MERIDEILDSLPLDDKDLEIIKKQIKRQIKKMVNEEV